MPTNSHRVDAMQRADQASALKAFLEPVINELVISNIHQMVGHYRGGTMSHDVLVGKVGEMSALLGLLSYTDGAMRAGEAARQEEFGDGPTETPTTPGTRTRQKSS